MADEETAPPFGKRAFAYSQMPWYRIAWLVALRSLLVTVPLLKLAPESFSPKHVHGLVNDLIFVLWAAVVAEAAYFLPYLWNLVSTIPPPPSMPPPTGGQS